MFVLNLHLQAWGSKFPSDRQILGDLLLPLGPGLLRSVAKWPLGSVDFLMSVMTTVFWEGGVIFCLHCWTWWLWGTWWVAWVSNVTHLLLLRLAMAPSPPLVYHAAWSVGPCVTAACDSATRIAPVQLVSGIWLHSRRNLLREHEALHLPIPSSLKDSSHRGRDYLIFV